MEDFSLEIQTETMGVPTGVLSLYSFSPRQIKKNFFYAGSEEPVHAVRVKVAYGEEQLFLHDQGGLKQPLKRNRTAEKQLVEELEALGFRKLTKVYHWIDKHDKRSHWLTLSSDIEWLTFFKETRPALEAKGWLIEQDKTFKPILEVADEWYADIKEVEDGSVKTEVGFTLEENRISIIPFLLSYLRDGKPIDVIQLPDGKKVMIPPERIERLVATLLELLDRKAVRKNAKSIRLPWIRAMELTEADLATELPKKLKAKVEQLQGVTNAPGVSVPGDLKADLRSYQQQGLNWLQLLRELGFGAVLADDMGLGKTVQALAHILCEKAAGRMTKPCLIIAPTSVVYNWEAEVKKFAPSLKVHVSHGSDRAEHFDKFAQHDLILTTYPLLSRDGEELLKHQFHLLILDEAQFIRNHRTIASQVVRLLKAEQRVALTGTPLENNLDELWSLFSFIMPGLLGSNTVFNQLFRKPIEKEEKTIPRTVLARRITPFLLRRTKNEVVLELPPKTEMVQRIELTQQQKELYETVRAAMDERVREAVKDKGVARSHIIVLDALLKMRQVCCHPQLLKSEQAEKITCSAKLNTLMEMLSEMIPEGRRILLFSQFTSMLKLIEDELNAKEIDYVKITGQTKDRKTPVADFQTGKVPVFLISLKAGGTGLNLTAADTVIHYDPWWNPAAEAQATDRAYRIGQDKPVFVYKLIAAESVEERILAMQERKKDLIDGLLGDQKEALKKWNEADLGELFKPIG